VTKLTADNENRLRSDMLMITCGFSDYLSLVVASYNVMVDFTGNP
jgi:hypothetical protein